MITKRTIQLAAIAFARSLLVAIACAFTVAALAVTLGSVGVVIGVLAVGIIGFLYMAHEAGEEVGVNWFVIAMLTFMSVPYFLAATASSAIATVILTVAFGLTLSGLRTWHSKVLRETAAYQQLSQVS